MLPLRHKVYAALVALGTLVLGAVFIHQVEFNRDLQYREWGASLVGEYAYSIEQQFNISTSATYTLATLLRHNNGQLEQFDLIAEDIMHYHQGVISNLQLAPNGVITQIHPLIGNEKALGHDLFKDPKRRDDAIRALTTRELTLTGPFNLIQGGNGVVVRLPVFLGPSENEHFWGFTVALIHSDKLIAASNLHKLDEQGFFYQLVKPESGQNQLITGNTTASLAHPVSIKVSVPNGEWRLDVVPKAGWVSPAWLTIESVIALAVALLMGKLTTVLFQQYALQQELKRVSVTDSLTGLCNRRMLDEALSMECGRSERTDSPFAVILLDIDKFKSVNDAYGHQAGDKVLIEFASLLRRTSRVVDTVGRWGGEEFLMVCPATDLAGAVRFSEKLRTATEGHDFGVIIGHKTASFGVSAYRRGDTPEAIVKRADDALYRAKSAGRNKVMIEDGGDFYPESDFVE